MIYLNHAGQAPWSAATQQAGLNAVHTNPWDSVAAANEASNQVRQRFARLLTIVESHDDDNDGSSSSSRIPPQDCIALLPSTAFAMTLAAHNLVRMRRQRDEQDANLNNSKQQQQPQARQRHKVLLLQDQYPSVVYPWQEICNLHPDEWSICVVPYPQDTDGSSSCWTDAILQQLDADPDISVVSLPPLHWADGRAIDLERVAQAIRQKEQQQQTKIDLIIDATQAVGIFPLRGNFLSHATLIACSAHKWLRGPSGVCCCYIHPLVHDEWQPLDQHERARNVDGATLLAGKYAMDPQTGYYPQEFVTTARKFDSGGKSHPILLPMLASSLEQVVQKCESCPLPLQQEELRLLMMPLMEWCRHHGWVVRDFDEDVVVDRSNDNNNNQRQQTPPRRRAYHLVGIDPPAEWNLTPQQLVQICQDLYQQHNIIVAARCGGLRISPNVESTPPQHIEALMRALEQVCSKYDNWTQT